MWCKDWIYETYRTLNLGGYNASTKEHAPQFWKLSRVILGSHMLEKRKRTEGSRQRLISFSSIDHLRAQFKKEQKAETIAMFDDDFEYSAV